MFDSRQKLAFFIFVLQRNVGVNGSLFSQYWYWYRYSDVPFYQSTRLGDKMKYKKVLIVEAI